MGTSEPPHLGKCACSSSSRAWKLKFRRLAPDQLIEKLDLEKQLNKIEKQRTILFVLSEIVTCTDYNWQYTRKSPMLIEFNLKTSGLFAVTGKGQSVQNILHSSAF
jgi:hypothetical protein